MDVSSPGQRTSENAGCSWANERITFLTFSLEDNFYHGSLFSVLIRATLRIRVSNRFLPEGNLRYDPHAHIWELPINICYNKRRGNGNLSKIANILHFIRLNCFVGKHPQIQLTHKYLFHIKISFHCFFFSCIFCRAEKGVKDLRACKWWS